MNKKRQPQSAQRQPEKSSGPTRNRVKELRFVKANELVPHPKNWRRHSQFQQDVLRGLLTEIGYADVLLASELPDGRLQLIDGHLRAVTTPDQKVPVVVLDVTQAEAETILLTLDPVASLAQADLDRVKELLASVTTTDRDILELFAMVADQAVSQLPEIGALVDPEPRIDKAAELQKKWRTKRGQLWGVGPHRLLCADSREISQVRRLMGDEAFRLCWTDSPYGVNYAKKNEHLNRTCRGNRIQTPIANDDLPPEQVRSLFENALKVGRRFAYPGAACYATVPSGSLLPYFIAGFDASGFSFKHQLIWVKNHFVIGRADYHYRHEPILYGWLEDGPHYFVDDRTQDSVFEIEKPHVSDAHSTCKPVQLIARMIANSTRPAEIVYDPFCGSGSSLLAAHQLRRIGRGVEIDPAYIAVTLGRMTQLGLKPELLES
jgi:DNA modification methylase